MADEQDNQQPDPLDEAQADQEARADEAMQREGYEQQDQPQEEETQGEDFEPLPDDDDGSLEQETRNAMMEDVEADSTGPNEQGISPDSMDLDAEEHPFNENQADDEGNAHKDTPPKDEENFEGISLSLWLYASIDTAHSETEPAMQLVDFGGEEYILIADPYSVATPTAIGTGAVGTSKKLARADHTHTGYSSGTPPPTPTSNLLQNNVHLDTATSTALAVGDMIFAYDSTPSSTHIILWNQLPVGAHTDGQVLTLKPAPVGAGLVPTWADASGGVIPVKTQKASDGAYGAGDATHTATFTYTVKDLKGVAIGGGAAYSPTLPRSLGRKIEAPYDSYGLGFYNGATFILWQTSECDDSAGDAA